MKYEFKGIPPETKIHFRWSDVGDIDLGHIDLDDFILRVFGPNQTPKARILRDSGISQVVAFPTSVQCAELMATYAKRYDGMTRTIQTTNGDILANLSPPSLVETFDIFWHKVMTMPDKQGSEETSNKDVEGCRKYMNNNWAKSRRSALIKFP